MAAIRIAVGRMGLRFDLGRMGEQALSAESHIPNAERLVENATRV
jgi:hypothetical protein